jgi:membrane associated rhomboid family serine protease
VVYLLSAVNVLAYLASSLAPPDAPYVYGLVPGRPSLLGFLASLFVHGSGFHLTVNLVVLWLFARDVEDAIGHAETLVLYVTSGLAANLMQAGAMVVLDPMATATPLVGASGAIAGIIGLFAVRWYFIDIVWGYGDDEKDEGVYHIPAWAVLMGLLGLQMAGAARSLWGRPDMVAYWGHLGGFVFGAAVGEALRLGRHARFDLLALQARRAEERSDHVTATRLYLRLLCSAPERPEDSTVLGEAGDANELLGEHAAALECYRRALNLALEQGNHRAARDAWHRLKRVPGALRGLPRDELERLANLLEQQSEFADAACLQGFMASLSSGPLAAGYLYHQARILARRMSRRSDAEEILARLRLEHPNSNWTRAAEDLMGLGARSGSS